MTRQSMGEYLGMSGEVVAMYERKERRLPVEALLKLQTLVMHEEHTSKAIQRNQRRERRQLRVQLRQRLRLLKMKVNRGQRKLKNMRQRYSILSAEDGPFAQNTNSAQASQISLFRFGAAAQAILEARIFALEWEVEMLEARLKEV